MPHDESEVSRVYRSREEARASYNRLSRWYGRLADPFERRYSRAGLRLLDTHHGARALEIGFGTGVSLTTLALTVGKTGKAYGIDLSEGMCAQARARAVRLGVADRIELVCGDAARLPFADNFFDTVFMSFTLELFDTPAIPQVLQECRRVLREGGRLGVVSLLKHRTPGLMERLYEWAHRTYPRTVDCRPIYVQQAIADAGFRLAEDHTLTLWGLEVALVVGVKAAA